MTSLSLSLFYIFIYTSIPIYLPIYIYLSMYISIFLPFFSSLYIFLDLFFSSSVVFSLLHVNIVISYHYILLLLMSLDGLGAYHYRGFFTTSASISSLVII